MLTAISPGTWMLIVHLSVILIFAVQTAIHR